jgi:hypothetical protein
LNPTTICNLALAEAQTRTSISGFPPIDNSPAAVSAGLFYSPKTQALLRSAPWDSCRTQQLLTLLRSVDDTPSDPPPQPFRFQYLYPSNCLKARFLIQYQTTTTSGVPLTSAPSNVIQPALANTKIPFVIHADIDPSSHAPRKTILTNMQNAILVYTADLSQSPDMWDPLFLSAETALLASYFAMNLSGDQRMVAQQIQIAKGVLDSARSANGNEAIANTDHIPDWVQARFQSGGGVWSGNANSAWNGWDSCEFPGGIWY